MRYSLALCPLLAATVAWCGFPASTPASSNPAERPTVIVVVGAPGEDEYGRHFREWAELVSQAARKGGAQLICIGFDEPSQVDDRDHLREALASEPYSGPHELWLILLGHGTFDGEHARFNLRGPDFTATELSEWLQPFQRRVAIINTASASAPFLNRLSHADRVIVTATRSGYELNYARFGGYFARAVGGLEADLDKDGQTSLLEAFLHASRKVEEFYRTEGRLATEHALLDDNGDARGTPADWFRGVRAVKQPASGGEVDGARAHQWHLIRSEFETRMSAEMRAERDALELQVIELRDRKETMEEEEYYRRLEELLVRIARLYQKPITEDQLPGPPAP